jgi:hypothetical protein
MSETKKTLKEKKPKTYVTVRFQALKADADKGKVKNARLPDTRHRDVKGAERRLARMPIGRFIPPTPRDEAEGVVPGKATANAGARRPA